MRIFLGNQKGERVRSELKNSDQIISARRKLEKVKNYQTHRRGENMKNKSDGFKKNGGNFKNRSGNSNKSGGKFNKNRSGKKY